MENEDLQTQVISTDTKIENANAMNNAIRKCYRCNSTNHLANDVVLETLNAITAR